MNFSRGQLKEKITQLIKFGVSLKGMIAMSTIGIWILVLQNLGIIPVRQSVYVENTVEVKGNVSARVYGRVNVDNTVDVNLSEINGHEYNRIPVYEY